jgi:hypothetical protein
LRYALRSLEARGTQEACVCFCTDVLPVLTTLIVFIKAFNDMPSSGKLCPVNCMTYPCLESPHALAEAARLRPMDGTRNEPPRRHSPHPRWPLVGQGLRLAPCGRLFFPEAGGRGNAGRRLIRQRHPVVGSASYWFSCSSFSTRFSFCGSSSGAKLGT